MEIFMCRMSFLSHTQLFYGSVDFVWNNLGEPVPEETFTHYHFLSSNRKCLSTEGK